MDKAALYRLMTWLSPSYPVGAFAYSHGIEWAVEDGRIRDEPTLRAWLEDLIISGGGWTDAVLFRHAYDRADDPDALADINGLALALAPSQERALETMEQGSAFLRITLDAWPWPNCALLSNTLGPKVTYPVVVALAAEGHGIGLDVALRAYCHGSVANLLSAGVRLIPLGQTAGQRILAALEVPIGETVRDARTAEIDDLGGIAILSEIASMRHETQYTRLFRS